MQCILYFWLQSTCSLGPKITLIEKNNTTWKTAIQQKSKEIDKCNNYIFIMLIDPEDNQ